MANIEAVVIKMATEPSDDKVVFAGTYTECVNYAQEHGEDLHYVTCDISRYGFISEEPSFE